MSWRFTVAMVAALLEVVVCPVAAQMIDAPPGAVRALFGGASSRQRLTLTVGGDWGIDDNQSPQPAPLEDDLLVLQSGQAATVLAALDYQRGRLGRFVMASGTAAVNYQQIGAQQGTNRLFRSDLTFQGLTNIGQRSGVQGAATVAYEPATLFGALDSLGAVLEEEPNLDPVVAPPASSSVAVTTQRWLSTQVAGSVYHSWTPRQRMDVRYEASRREPINGAGLEAQAQAISVFHAWSPNPNGGVDVNYRFDDRPQLFENGFEQPFRSHTAEGRVRFGRPQSPRRAWAVLVGAGAVRTTTRTEDTAGDFSFVAPIGSASFRYEMSRNWAMAFAGRRDVTVLGGLSVEPFSSNAAVLSLNGVVARRMTLGASTSYSRGTSRVSDTGGFTMVAADLQLRYGLSPRLGLLFRYNYADHRLSDVSVVSSTFPNRFASNSFRVGITTWLPMFGSF